MKKENFIDYMKRFELHDNRILVLIFVFFVAISMVPNIVLGENSYSVTVVAGSILMGSLCLLNIYSDFYRKAQMKRHYLILFAIIGGSFLFNGLYFGRMAYVIIGITFAIVIPITHIILSGCGVCNITKSAVSGIKISFIFFLIASVIFGPSLSEFQYSSFLGNPNAVGYYMIVVVASLLFTLQNYRKNESYKKRIYTYILLGLSLSLMLFSNSRTSIVACFIGIVFYIVVQMFHCLMGDFRRDGLTLLKRLIVFVLIWCICFASTFFLLTTVNKAFAKIIDNIVVPSYDVDKGDETGSDVTMSENIELIGDRLGKGIGESGDAFTSGRIGIWEDYISNIGLLGHDKEERAIVSGGRVYENTNAHNVYLQVAYSAGMIAGIAMLVLVILIAKDLIWTFLKKFKEKTTIDGSFVFITFLSIGFSVVSITAASYMPYTYVVSTFFWIMIYPITSKKK